jgi:hypothetical protein
MEVWLQDACEHFVITWACHYSLVLLAVLLKELELQFHRELHTEYVPAAQPLIVLDHL